MNVDHFGIVVTLIIAAIFLSIALVSQTNIQIFPTTGTSEYTGFASYCKTMNIKC